MGAREPIQEWARRVLLALSVALALMFGTATLAIAVAPAWVERQVRPELVRRVAGDVLERHPELAKVPWFEPLGKALGAEAERVESWRARLERARLALADYLVVQKEWQLCRFDCDELPDFERQRVRQGAIERVSRWLPRDQRTLPRVSEWARGRYQVLMGELLRDLGVVTLTNALTFALAALAILRSYGSRAALLLATILTVAALGASWLYLFAQNWLHTMLFSTWLGYGYVVWVLLFAAALCDLAFNRGRVLNLVVNAIATAVEHAFSGL